MNIIFEPKPGTGPRPGRFRRYAGLFLLPLLGGLLLTACQNAQEPESAAFTGTITGEVYDKSTGTGLDLANVRTDPPTSSVTTDSLGFYQILNVPAGVYVISARKVGYDSTTVDVSVLAEQTTIGDVPLSADSTATP